MLCRVLENHFFDWKNQDALCAKCHAAADAWAPVADDLWANGHWITSKRRKQNASKIYNDPNAQE